MQQILLSEVFPKASWLIEYPTEHYMKADTTDTVFPFLLYEKKILLVLQNMAWKWL